jgi:predicted thioesterase
MYTGFKRGEEKTMEHKVHEKEYAVTERDAIHFMGPDAPPVLATPALLQWMEMTSRENAGPLLGPGEETVGFSANLKHLAATPIGMKVRIISKLTKVDGKRYLFEVEAFDEVEKIGEAVHERARVNVAKFASRVTEKIHHSGHRVH